MNNTITITINNTGEAGSCGANGGSCTRCAAGSWKPTGGTQCGCTLCQVCYPMIVTIEVS
jgi:hypothetical protein